MNYVENKYNKTTYGYQYFHFHGDGDSLVAMLKCGHRYEELTSSKELHWDDWHKVKYKDA
ncbi:MAG: hypothetical protein HRT38_20015 [Alteromonadaceae bacterium]|nr:hypothetical protein [Alteromonadaceae bacterium]